MRRSPLSPGILLATLLACSTRTASEPAPAAPVARSSPATTDRQELHAFARLYGYVRYFHPSDEAAQLNWDAFAVHGVQQVTAAQTRDELAQILESLFLPVAPTLDVYVEGDAPRDAASLFPAETAGLDVVAWQHRGYGFGDMTTAYTSIRTHRRRELAQGPQTRGIVAQSVDVAPLRGRRVRARLWARVDPSGPVTTVQPVLVIERRGGGETWATTSKRLETEWTESSFEAEIPPDAKDLTLQIQVGGQGAAWVDDVSLELQDGEQWRPVELDNPGFEEHQTKARGWDTDPDNFRFVGDESAHGGQRALRVARNWVPAPSELFEATPEPGELLTARLARGVYCRLPLSLYSRGDRTLGPPGAEPPPAPPDLTGVPRSPEDPAVRMAAVIVAWNVFQHFYPYFDVVEVDWEAVLPRAIAKVSGDATPEQTHRTLEWMVAQLHDGHGQVKSPVHEDQVSVPVHLWWVENRVVVAAAPEDSPLRRGDVVRKIDGEDVMARLEAELVITSGSPQWRRYRLLRWGRLTHGPKGSMARLELQRGDQTLSVEIERRDAAVPPVFEREPIERLEGGVWYIDMARAEWTKIYAQIEAIAEAPGVIFDLRGYPNSTHPVLRHLMTEPEQDKWMFVPEIVYPDHQRVTGWEEYGWDMSPAVPHIQGKVAFITGSGAISYAESVMGYVEGLKLGEIVGGPTAGANGNINPFTTPGGYTVYFTGMRVLKHDGSQHHTIGVLPTVPAEPTLAGVRQGRDELLERARVVVGSG